ELSSSDFHRASDNSLLFAKPEHVQRLTCVRMLDFRRNDRRYVARTAAAETGRNGDVLMAARTERDRETLHRGAEPRLPEHLAGAHVVCAEVAIQIAHERQATRSGQHARQIRGPLFVAPDFL